MFILAYVALALQVGLGPHITWGGAAPNLVLIAAVFIGMNASRDAALLGCLIIGLMQDLLTGQQLGSYAFSYGLVGLFVVNTQQVVYRDHPLTHFALVLIGAIITLVVVVIAGWLHSSGAIVNEGGVRLPAATLSIGLEFKRAFYTALLAPLVLWALARVRRVFAFQGSYRKSRR